MTEAYSSIISFLKKETVFSGAAVLAAVSAFIVVPDREYLGYFNLHVLGLLLSMMLVMEGFKRANFFSRIGEKLMDRSMGLRAVGLILTLLCFFSSMLITNDIALITFVPFTIFILRKSGMTGYLIPIITLQTVAANLGSMLTPIGNPQNLYLYTLSGMDPGDFCLITLPYCAVSLAVLLSCCFLLPGGKKLAAGGCGEPDNACPCRAEAENGGKKVSEKDRQFSGSGEREARHGNSDEKRLSAHPAGPRTDRKKTFIFTVLFISCILTVFRLFPWWASLALVCCTVLIVDRRIFLSIDYFLLLTFCAFFVLIGNIQRLEPVRELLEALVGGHEVIVGAAASQIISNVPAAILLSGFTSDLESLVIGVSIGGLGTLIASMASLISYKLLAHEFNSLKGRYIIYFSIYNYLFLAILTAMCHSSFASTG